MANESRRPTVVSMFCGCGGLDHGFHHTGYDVVWANDFNEDACLTYEANLGKVTRGNIEELQVPQVDDLDVLLSGFPCQSFSNAGNRKGVYEKRGNLYKYTLKFVQQLKPKVVMIENVRGLLSTRTETGFLLEEIFQSLSEMNYEIHFKLVNASHYGVPQNRLRVIVVALRKDANLGQFYFPDAITDIDLSIKATIFDIPSGTPNADEEIRLNPQAIRLGKLVPEGGSWKDIPTEELPERLKKIRGNMEKYRWPNFYRRFHRDEIAGTITAAFKPENAGVWHPVEDRVFTTREIARIQSFPDSFRFMGRTIKSNYEMIGNAVPPKLSEVFALQIRRVLAGESIAKPDQIRYFSKINFGSVPVRVSDPEVIYDESLSNKQLELELLSV